VNKKIFKLAKRYCAICKEPNYNLLDVHRINEGKEYSPANCIALCCNCHRRHHSKEITIREKRYSTDGWILIIERDGLEEYIKI
jgi:5-methylcytosine-specific restriction endonuclease McrA